MQLIFSNEQGQLHPLERGLHALRATGNGLTLRAYAEQIGKNEQTVQNWKQAAEVAVTTGSDWKDLLPYMRHLSLIHAAAAGARVERYS